MTAAATERFPWPLYVLSAFLVLFAIRDYLGIGGVYGTLRVAGIPPDGVWDFAAHPREASLYLLQHVLAGVSFVALLSFWTRSRIFPFLFAAYYVSYVTIALYSFSSVGAGAVGPIAIHSIICVPWLLYIFKSPRARAAFRIGSAPPTEPT